MRKVNRRHDKGVASSASRPTASRALVMNSVRPSLPPKAWLAVHRKAGTAQRGDERYVLNGATGLIRDIRACCVASVVQDASDLPAAANGLRMGERVYFGYAERGQQQRWE